MQFKELQESAYRVTKNEVNKISKQIIASYDEALLNINKQLKDTYAKLLAGEKDFFKVMSKYNRLDKLYKSIQSEYSVYLNTTGNLTKQASSLSLSNMYYKQQYALNWQLDENTVFVGLKPQILEASVYGQDVAWQNLQAIYGNKADYMPKSGTLLSTLLSKRKKPTEQKILDTLRRSFITNQNYTDTARELKTIMTTDLNSALRVVRTESHRNANIGLLSATQEAKAQGVNIKRQILSVLDDRTRPQSASMDGQEENKNGYFVYPGGLLVRTPGNSGVAAYDINDRETTIDIVDGKSPEVRRARNPATGETDIISFSKFPDWAKENGLKKNVYGQYYTSDK